MIDELYLYACPKLLKEQKRTSDILYIMFFTMFFSAVFTLLIGKFVFAIVHVVLYLFLSSLLFLNKDFNSRYMGISAVSILSILLTAICMLSYLFPGSQLPLLILVFGVIFSISYEIVFILKIKKKLYSTPPKSKKTVFIVSTSNVFLYILIFRIINKKQPKLAVMILVLLCSVVVLFAIILFQKLIIYLLTKNKIQASDDVD